jgi:hypothetical protein
MHIACSKRQPEEAWEKRADDGHYHKSATMLVNFFTLSVSSPATRAGLADAKMSSDSVLREEGKLGFAASVALQQSRVDREQRPCCLNSRL